MLPGRLIHFTDARVFAAQSVQGNERIIQIGSDAELLRLRQKLFSTAGYSVRSVTPQQASQAIEAAQLPSLWLFCSTLTLYELATLGLAVRRSRSTDKLLSLAGMEDIGPAVKLFDQRLQPTQGIDALLAAVDTLTKNSLTAGSR